MEGLQEGVKDVLMFGLIQKMKQEPEIRARKVEAAISSLSSHFAGTRKSASTARLVILGLYSMRNWKPSSLRT